ncbi:glycoside hydrolase family 30 protein [Bifidobacterium sp.]|nr:glycoside hydrolase family 30 beta sandwich domain-containing protein [Bifidobacterium sp.]MCI1224582.1 glucan endo-1,6-beta-glucosidase [Bifidobacterium sp.]
MFVTQARDDDSGLLRRMEGIEVLGAGGSAAGMTPWAAENPSSAYAASTDTLPRIEVDAAKHRQRIDGFGASITEATGDLWAHAVNDPDQMIRDLFDPIDGIGLSMLRQPIGPSDHVTRPYSFVRRWPDKRLRSLRFTVEEQRILPMLEAAQAASLRDVERDDGRLDARRYASRTAIRAAARAATQNAGQQRQGLRIIASPWSAPWWMKTNLSVLGRRRAWPHCVGRLRRSYYDAYARYLAAFVRLYRDHGFDVFGLTPVNEPDNAQAVWPSMAMNPEEQAAFIAEYLAPRLQTEGLGEVNIMCWDHNYSTERYPEGDFVKQFYAHGGALQATAGSAWHYYGGSASVMSRIHERWPNKGIWMTEASGGDWGPRNWEAALLGMSGRVIAMLRNWAQCVVLWNIALDTDGGPDYYYLRHDRQHSRNRGLLTIDRASGVITKNADYYVIGHFSRFVPVGSRCVGSVASHDIPGVHHVAFLTSDDHLVLVANNEDAAAQRIAIQDGCELRPIELPPRSLSTVVWEH